jgi:integrase
MVDGPLGKEQERQGASGFCERDRQGIIGNRTGFIFPSPRPVILPDGTEKIVPITVGALACALRRNIKGQDYRKKRLKRGHVKELPADLNRLGVEFFTPHDLRRTVATRMAEMGIMEEIIDRVLNHTRQGIIRTYNHYAYDKELLVL